MKFLWIVLLVFLPSKGFAQWGLPGWPSLYIMLPNGQTPCTVDFEDFVAFAQAYGSTSEDQHYNFRADTNQDGIVNFPDFIAFAGQFGLSMPGTQEDCLRASRTHIQVSGVVKQAEKPFANVWVDAVGVDSLNAVRWEKTDSLGVFQHAGLLRGKYAFVPHQLGYVFTPDTLWATVEDASLTLPSVDGVFSFGVMDVQVMQDSLRVPQVDVSFLWSVSGQKADGPWVGVTDASGVTVIRMPVLDGELGLAGTYVVRVTDTATGDVLGVWNSVPVVLGDTRRLVLDVGREAYYVPKRDYFYYDWDQKRIDCEASDTRLNIKFRDGVDPNQKAELLNRLGLRAVDNFVFELQHDKGRLAVLEMMHRLRRSEYVQSVIPEVDMGHDRVYWPDQVFIHFKDEVAEADVEGFLQDVGASLVQVSAGIHVVQFADVLTYDVFEICERYRTHPLIISIYPEIRGRYRLLKP